MRSRPLELLLQPVDNQQLANLCGALDENLRQIEAAYDVAIARRGERFTLHGHPAQTAQAAQALQHFYSQAKDHLSVDDIQLGLVELKNRSQAGQAAPGLLTRKTDLHGRTPRQVQYLRQIQEHDITF
ncbi:MAG: PhoH family protein, partial [Pseudomonadota bacterium]